MLLSGLLPTEASRERLRRLLNERSDEIDWPTVVRRAERHGTAALLRFNLARGGWLDLVPAGERAALDEVSRNDAVRQLAFVSEAARLIEALARHHITALPLKGAALMLGGYYPQAGLRAAVDIDLLVHPNQIQPAEQIALQCGYREWISERQAPIQPRLRQAARQEAHHAAVRRGPGGVALELHYRAFECPPKMMLFSRARDFGFAEMIPRAVPWRAEIGGTLRLPAPEDLCLHLVQHTVVDWQSAHLMLRTLADLYFILEREPEVSERLERRAAEFKLSGAVRLALEALQLAETATLEELDQIPRRADVALLLEAALSEPPAAFREAMRLFTYFDFRRHPLQKLGNLFALIFTSKPHLAQLYQAPATSRVYLNYWRRPFDLLRKLHWEWIAPGNVRRLMRFRKLTRYSGQ